MLLGKEAPKFVLVYLSIAYVVRFGVTMSHHVRLARHNGFMRKHASRLMRERQVEIRSAEGRNMSVVRWVPSAEGIK